MTDGNGHFHFSTKHELGWKSNMIPGKVVTQFAERHRDGPRPIRLDRLPGCR